MLNQAHIEKREWCLEQLRAGSNADASLSAEWLANHEPDAEVIEALIEAIQHESKLVREGVQIGLRIILYDRLSE